MKVFQRWCVWDLIQCSVLEHTIIKSSSYQGWALSLLSHSCDVRLQTKECVDIAGNSGGVHRLQTSGKMILEWASWWNIDSPSRRWIRVIVLTHTESVCFLSGDIGENRVLHQDSGLTHQPTKEALWCKPGTPGGFSDGHVPTRGKHSRPGVFLALQMQTSARISCCPGWEAGWQYPFGC